MSAFVPGLLAANDNPLEWAGPAFLVFYVSLLAAGITVAALIRYALRQPGGAAPDEALDLHPYEAAYLAGGERQTASTVLARLIHSNVLAAGGSDHKLAQAGPLADDAHFLERAALDAVPLATLGTIKDARKKIAEHLHPITTRLRELGLIPGEGHAFGARVLPFLLMTAILGFGVAKLCIGNERGKPVGFLIVLLLMGGLVTLIGFGRRVLRSQRGSDAFNRLKAEHATLATVTRRQPQELAAHDFSLAVALYGTSVLSSGPLADVHTALTPPSGSSCGGGGCGGGGGGGGGCGGGGCGGGCGGCGGG